MKIVKKILFWLGIIIILGNLAIIFSGYSYVYKTLYYQYADIDDYTIFQNRTVKAGNYRPIAEARPYNKNRLPKELEAFLCETQTIAFLVLKNDSIQYEEYWDGYNANAYSGSFSVAKSIVSLLTGIAIDEGKIKSVDQAVSDFIPEYSGGLRSKLTIRHLLTMSAGFDWDERYNSLFSPTTRAYYGGNLKKMVLNLEVNQEPGKYFEYQSCNQLVLAYILEKATGVTLSDYASEKLWKPLGAKNDALWSLDGSNGFEKAYCCFNSNARDFSRIGTLLLHHGMCNGNRIISEKYLDEAVAPTDLIDENDERANYYGYSWWLARAGTQQLIYARGIGGQFIIVIPESDMVIVRLGKKIMDKDGVPAVEYIAGTIIKDFQ